MAEELLVIAAGTTVAATVMFVAGVAALRIESFNTTVSRLLKMLAEACVVTFDQLGELFRSH